MNGTRTNGRCALVVLATIGAALGALQAQASGPRWPGPMPSLPDTAARSGATGLSRTGLMAILEVRDHEGAPARQRSRIELDEHGRRITQLGAGAVQRIVIDADAERIWMIDRGRRIVHEIPLIDASDPADVEAANVVLPGPVRAFPNGGEGALLEPALCEGLHATAMTRVTWRGRPATSATCTDALGNVAAVQTFDAIAGLVVRRVATDGTVEELRDIEPMTFGADHFLPAASLRAVGIRELLGRTASVASYREP